MTELKSYSLPELEELAEQIKATILKREQEEQEAARRQAEEAERAARAAEEEAARLAAEAAAKAAAEAEEKARAATAARERKQAAEKARREAAEAKAKAEAEKAKEAAQAEISFAEAAPPAPTEMPLVRFMHPSNRALTWSGDGPKPDWVNAWLATGGTLYALEIAAEKLAPKPIPASLRPR
ncbi:MAG: hypothetical protein JSS57_26665 [Proteobacteria bacterium]|nr:hypothetical protein [Pseudomonadota bacterium]